MRAIGKGVLFFLAFGVAGYAVFAYCFLPLGSLVYPDMKANFLAHPVGIYTHVFASIVALTLGPFQFSSHLRQTRIQVHRWLGRAYLAVGVLGGGLAGLYMSQFAFGGTVARLGFATLAVCWLYSACGRSWRSAVAQSTNIAGGWCATSRLRLPPSRCGSTSRHRWPRASICWSPTPSSHGCAGCRICCSQSGDTTPPLPARRPCVDDWLG